MFQDYFRDSEFLSLPLVALILFLGAFLGAVVRTWFGMGGREGVERMAALPLEDGAATARMEDDEDV